MSHHDFLKACAARVLPLAEDALPAGLETPHSEAITLAAELREAAADFDAPADPDDFIETARAEMARHVADLLVLATAPAAPDAGDLARAREAACAATSLAAEAATWEAAEEDEADPWVAVLERVDDLGCDKAEYRQWLQALDVARVAITDAADGDVEAVRADRITWWDTVLAAGRKAAEKLAQRKAEPGAVARVWDVAARALERLVTLDPVALRLNHPADPQLPAIALAAAAAGEIARLAESNRQAADLAGPQSVG